MNNDLSERERQGLVQLQKVLADVPRLASDEDTVRKYTRLAFEKLLKEYPDDFEGMDVEREISSMQESMVETWTKRAELKKSGGMNEEEFDSYEAKLIDQTSNKFQDDINGTDYSFGTKFGIAINSLILGSAVWVMFGTELGFTEPAIIGGLIIGIIGYQGIKIELLEHELKGYKG